jgi:hypothetical protein
MVKCYLQKNSVPYRPTVFDIFPLLVSIGDNAVWQY